MPVERAAVAFGIPIPFYVFPDGGDVVAQLGFIGARLIEIGPCGEQSLDEVGGFYEVATVIIAGKGDDFAVVSIEPMGVGAVEGLGGIFEEGGHFLDAGKSLRAGNKSSVDAGDDGHDTHARATRGNEVARGIAFAGEAAIGVGVVPEVLEGIVLDAIEQGFV